MTGHKINIKDLSASELLSRLEALQQAPYRHVQIFQWLYRIGVKSFDEMTDIPLDFRETLKKQFHISHPVMLDSRRSSLDGTTKCLLKLEDGNTIETVWLPEKGRNTICLSSQVGCKYACSFCASSPLGFIRNLAQSEIVNQVIFLKSKNPSSALTNLVFMGIGEPLDNYDNVLKAIRVFNDPKAFNIGARKITISTCGIIPGIKKLEKEGLQIELSVSLHSADDVVRSRLVPINKRYPLKDLMDTCKEYTAATKRIITFEYALMKGVNSAREDALKLAQLLGGMKCKVNIISYNKVKDGKYSQPPSTDVKAFINALKDKGINVTGRKSRGDDIDAGCGQLRISRL